MLQMSFECYGDHRDLHVLTHSFPTRRSSDLLRPYNTGAHYPPLGRPSRTAQAGADLSQYIRDSAHGGLAASPLRKSTKPTQSKRTVLNCEGIPVVLASISRSCEDRKSVV